MKGLNIALICGGIAAFLLREQIATALFPHAAAPATPATPGTPATPATPAAAAGIWDRLQTWARTVPEYQTGGTMTTHSWNAGYVLLRGHAGPSPDQIGQGDGNTKITFEEYKAGMTAAGLSAVRGVQPMIQSGPAAMRQFAKVRPSLTAGAYSRRTWGY